MEAWLGHVVPFVLVLFRVAGVAIGAPLISGRMIPFRARALLVVTLSAALYPAVWSRGGVVVPDAGVLELGALAARETLVGLAMGVIAGLPIAGATLGGFVMGHQMGLGLAQTYNPEAEMETDVTGQLMTYLATGAFLAAGGLETLFVTLAGTFERLPIGGMALGETPVGLMATVISSGFELALRVAAPVTCLVFMSLLAMGMISKTIPQLNVMSVGFAMKIVAGLVVLAASLVAIEEAIGDEHTSVLDLVRGWALGLGGGGPDGG